MTRLPSNPIAQLEQFLTDFERPVHSKYPPENVFVNDSDESVVIELAVAGFSIDDISIVEEENRIIVDGKKDKQENELDGWTTVVRGISGRDFSKVWLKKASYKVQSAEMHNGILRIVLIKDQEKIRSIQIEYKGE